MSDNNVIKETVDTDDISNAEITEPRFDKIRILCIIGEVVKETREYQGQKFANLIVPLTTEEPATATDGRTVQPGYKIRGAIPLTATDKLTQEFINEMKAKFQVAALGLTKQEANLGDLSRYAGRKVVAYCVVRPDKNDPTKTYQDVRGFNKVA